jgi:SH3-like domain-containing protein
MRNRIIPALGVAALAVLFSTHTAATRGTVYLASAAPAPNALSPAPACDARAYVIDKDPKGLNVRETPGTDGRVVAVIPLNEDGTIVHMVSADSKGWVRIDRAETIEGNVVFDKKGWVSGNMLGTETRGYGTKGVKLYAAAGRGAKVLGTVPPETEVKIYGCEAERVQVRYRNLLGWLDAESQCPNPVTLCN